MTFNVFITLRLIQFGKNKQDAGCQMPDAAKSYWLMANSFL